MDIKWSVHCPYTFKYLKSPASEIFSGKSDLITRKVNYTKVVVKKLS